MNPKEYYLHSREGNSFHFRLKDKNTVFESFTVTYAVDGTAIMSGDMGNIMWKRNYFPNGNHDYGFPGADTGISYFEEKVKIAMHEQKTEVFDMDKAIEDVKRYILEELEDEPKEYDEMKERIERFISDYSGHWDEYSIDEVSHCRLYEDLCSEFPDTDWTELMSHIGMKWDPVFEYRFEILKSVSPMIKQTVYGSSEVVQ